MQFLSDLWVPVEDAIMNVLRSAHVVPGRYVVPWMDGGELMKTPEGRAKVEAGPIVYLTVQKSGMPNMGIMMAQTLVSSLVISVFVGYLAWHALPPAADYLEVFRITGTATFMAYALGVISESIWFARPWKSLAMNTFDALLYAGVAGGVFGWLWRV